MGRGGAERVATLLLLLGGSWETGRLGGGGARSSCYLTVGVPGRGWAGGGRGEHLGGGWGLVKRRRGVGGVRERGETGGGRSLWSEEDVVSLSLQEEVLSGQW